MSRTSNFFYSENQKNLAGSSLWEIKGKKHEITEIGAKSGGKFDDYKVIATDIKEKECKLLNLLNLHYYCGELTSINFILFHENMEMIGPYRD